MTSVGLGAAAVEGRFRRLQRGKHGLPAEAVAADQRARIFEALVMLVATKGYQATTLQEVAKVAHVSRERIRLVFGFGSKEECFLWALNQIVGHAIGNANRAYLAESDWHAKLTSGFSVFMREVLDRPDAARVALVEALSAGPAAVQRMEGAASEFEAMLRSTFAVSPDRVLLHPLIAKGVVGGVSRVVRQRLIDSDLDTLREETDSLVSWMLAYHSVAGASLAFRRVPDPTPFGASRLRAAIENGDERCKLMVAAARLATRHGYTKLSVEAVAQHADVPASTFHELFPGGTEECFLDAYNRLGADVTAVAAKASRAAPGDWPQRVIAGLHAILWRIGRDPVFARMAFVEVFRAGPAGITQRSELMESFSELLLAEAPADDCPSQVVSEAIVGAVWQLAHQTVTRDATHRLPELGDFASYLILAPLLGGGTAIRELRRPA
jgi:AcrR family transcriptional regulator